MVVDFECSAFLRSRCYILAALRSQRLQLAGKLLSFEQASLHAALARASRGRVSAGPRRRRRLDVHLAAEVDRRLEGVSVRRINGLLRLYGRRHHHVVRLQRLDVVLLAAERGLGVANGLDALAQAVLTDLRNDLAGVLLL